MENVRIQVGDFILTTTTKKTSVDYLKHEKVGNRVYRLKMYFHKLLSAKGNVIHVTSSVFRVDIVSVLEVR